MSSRSLPIAAVAVSVVLWSTAYVATGIALRTTSPAVLSVLRFVLTAVPIVPFAIGRRGFASAFWSWRSALLGFTGVSIYNSFANLGQVFTTAGTAALLSALLPVLTAGFALWLLRERLGVRTIAGLALATVGVALVASAGLRFDLGVALIVIALISYSFYTVLLRREGEREELPDTITLSAVTAIWGVLFMLPWMLWEIATGQARFPAGIDGIAATLYLGLIVSALTLVLYTYGAARLPAAVSGVMAAGIPALGYLFAVLAGEPLTWPKLAGGALAIAGIAVATVQRRRAVAGALTVRVRRVEAGREEQ